MCFPLPGLGRGLYGFSWFLLHRSTTKDVLSTFRPQPHVELMPIPHQDGESRWTILCRIASNGWANSSRRYSASLFTSVGPPLMRRW